MSSPKEIKITQEKCYEKFRELQLGFQSQKKRAKLSKDDHMKQIEDILKEFDVKIKPMPLDEQGANLWKNEQQRIYNSFLRMKAGFRSKKFDGVFYNSTTYSTYAVPAKDTNDTENIDPTVQVRFGPKKVGLFQ